MRMFSRCIMRAYFEPHGSRRAEKYSLYGDRRADVHNLFAAGREHTGHRAFGACGEGIKKLGTICTELLRRMMQLSYVIRFILSFEF